MTLLTVLPRLRTNNLKGLGATLTLEAFTDVDDQESLRITEAGIAATATRRSS
jgi:hypothetical protein